MRALLNRIRFGWIQKHYAELSLNESSLSHIYAKDIWAGPDRDGYGFYSGPGASGPFFERYSTMVKPEIAALGATFSVADLGCGDFHVGNMLAGTVANYTGVDISQAVIEHHQKIHATPRIHFVRADLTSEALPSADLAIVRQVLQHLSNAEIQLVLANVCRTFKLALVEQLVVARLLVPVGLALKRCTASSACLRSSSRA